MVRSPVEAGTVNDDSVELDPEIAAILREAAGLDLPDPTALSIAAARSQLATSSLAWNVELPALPVVRDRSVPGPEGAIGLRLCRPQSAGRLPAVVYLHGGGWTFGSVDAHDRLMRLLSRAAEAAVIGVDYRLAPEHPFPAPLEDCRAAICWARGYADAPGSSASASWLRAILRLLRSHLNTPIPCPLRRRQLSAEHRRDRLVLEQVARHGARGPSRCTPNPVGLPPLYLTLAAADPVADDMRELARRLAKSGVPYQVREYPGTVHSALQMAARSAAARRAPADTWCAIRNCWPSFLILPGLERAPDSRAARAGDPSRRRGRQSSAARTIFRHPRSPIGVDAAPNGRCPVP
jgi:acetyl esterase